MTDEAERFRAAVMERLHVGSYDGMSMKAPRPRAIEPREVRHRAPQWAVN